eukprot:15473396-Alexandrium_andersonii.AAC.1
MKSAPLPGTRRGRLRATTVAHTNTHARTHACTHTHTHFFRRARGPAAQGALDDRELRPAIAGVHPLRGRTGAADQREGPGMAAAPRPEGAGLRAAGSRRQAKANVAFARNRQP